MHFHYWKVTFYVYIVFTLSLSVCVSVCVCVWKKVCLQALYFSDTFEQTRPLNAQVMKYPEHLKIVYILYLKENYHFVMYWCD